MKTTTYALMAALMITLSFTTTATAGSEEKLVIYSARKAHLVEPVFNLYTRESGVEIAYITDKAPVLLERIRAEGKNTPADMLITVDAGNLWHAADKGIFSPVTSDVLTRNIPSHLRDPDHRWFGLSVRARTLVYSTQRVDPDTLSTYENLAHPRWKDRLVLRTAKKVYNQSLVAMLLAEHGREKTESIISGWVNNLAAPPFSNDTRVMESIIAGQGDVGIVNTYYFGRLLKKDPTIPLALFWPNQERGGVHVNVSGAGIIAHSKNKARALAFLEWLSSPGAQKLFADVNMEYPVHADVETAPIVAKWGAFKQNRTHLNNAGQLQGDAVRLMDRVNYR